MHCEQLFERRRQNHWRGGGQHPDEFALRITSHDSRIRKCRVLWRSDDTLRVEFTDRVTSAEEPAVKNSARELAY